MRCLLPEPAETSPAYVNNAAPFVLIVRRRFEWVYVARKHRWTRRGAAKNKENLLSVWKSLSLHVYLSGMFAEVCIQLLRNSRDRYTDAFMVIIHFGNWNEESRVLCSVSCRLSKTGNYWQTFSWKLWSIVLADRSLDRSGTSEFLEYSTRSFSDFRHIKPKLRMCALKCKWCRRDYVNMLKIAIDRREWQNPKWTSAREEFLKYLTRSFSDFWRIKLKLRTCDLKCYWFYEEGIALIHLKLRREINSTRNGAVKDDLIF